MVTRLRRHSVLLRDRPPHLVALIDELALHRVIGGPDVLRRQLDHLVELSVRPNIDIRVIPNDRAHAGINGAFTVLRRREGEPVVFLENLTSSLFLEERDEVQCYQYAIRELLAHSLGAESRRDTSPSRHAPWTWKERIRMSSESSTPTWHKSSYSGSQENCVEIAQPGPAVLVRDSKNRAGDPIALPSPTFHGLVRNLRFERT